jgi:hypothetical protein
MDLTVGPVAGELVEGINVGFLVGVPGVGVGSGVVFFDGAVAGEYVGNGVNVGKGVTDGKGVNVGKGGNDGNGVDVGEGVEEGTIVGRLVDSGGQ